MVLFPMESNLLKIRRKYPDSNSRRLREAILLVLHRVNGYLKHEDIDVEKFENEDMDYSIMVGGETISGIMEA